MGNNVNNHPCVKLLNDCMMETSYLQGGGLMSIGDPITATRIGVAIVPLF